MGCLKLEYLDFTELRAEKNEIFARGKNGAGSIVAGLNHVMHRMEENNRIRSALSDPDGIPEANMDSVNNIKSEVHDLFTSDMKKYEGKASVSIDLNTNSAFAAQTDSGGIGADTGKIGKVRITYFKQAFQSNYSLAKSILHEYYHVADFYSGRATGYFLNYRKQNDSKKSARLMIYNLEQRAYKFIYNLGDKTSIFDNVKKSYGF